MTRGEALLAWYETAHRDLPWRRTSDPYRILVSEVMLQQTGVSRVVPAYESFLSRFPTADALAASPLDSVLDAWQGLGYPTRARRLRETARIVSDTGWPRTASGLESLPGIGPYTAAAVASFAFGERIAAVDTNVRRVISRWRGDPLIGRAASDAASDEMTGDASTWNQAVMELGALVCRPDPRCGECPVAEDCNDPSIYLPPPRQSRYEGSLRQVRGDILRALGTATHPVPVEDLDGDPKRIEIAVDSLVHDRLVLVDDRGVSIAG